MSEQSPIHAVFLEDNPDDVTLVRHELRRALPGCELHHVERKEEFLRAVSETAPDVILSDHGLPGFDGMAALRLAQERCPDVPFLFVTGSLGEERIIETLRNGATDYVLKHQLSKLAPAIRRALREAEERRRRQEAEAERERLIAELQEALRKVKTLSGLLPICAACKKIRDDRGYWNRLETYIQEHSCARLTHGICPDCAERMYPGLTQEPGQVVV